MRYCELCGRVANVRRTKMDDATGKPQDVYFCDDHDPEAERAERGGNLGSDVFRPLFSDDSGNAF